MNVLALNDGIVLIYLPETSTVSEYTVSNVLIKWITDFLRTCGGQAFYLIVVVTLHGWLNNTTLW